MANFNKAFNFRGGFQVDEDTFLVRGSNVGIGSSVPSERLDVDGVIKARGLIIDSTDVVAITTAYVGLISATEIHAGIFTGTPENGGIATYYGDGSQLLNLPTSQWLDIDVGLGFTSIYAQGNVGVDTTDPRYKFQVGGVPFKTKTGPLLQAQDGVGVEDGNIYFSGIASARFKPGLEKQGFVGYGSYINTLNASELTTGDIPSYAYGDLIITEEIIAPKLTGIASTAIGVTTDAQLSFDTAVANEIKAINRFISTEGYLQIGTDEDVAGVGDIEVVKDTDNSNIYSISNSGDAQVFVGSERPGGSNRGFGGIRMGLFPSEPLTGSTDLDLVNYDIGNLNLYLHSGSGGQGATTGKIRFIYGQRDSSLLEIDKDGVTTLPDNVVVTGPLLYVGGSAYFKGGAQLDGDLNVTSGIGSFAGDVNISGELSAGSLTLAGIVTLTGVDLQTLKVGDTEITATPNEANLCNLLSVDGATNSVTISGSLESTTLTTNLFNADTIIFATSLTGPNGFSVDSSAVISGSSISISGGGNFGGTVGFGSISASDITSGSANIGSLDSSNVTADNVIANNVTVNTSFNAATISVTDIQTTNIQSDDTNFNRMTAGEVRTSDINNQGSDVGFSDNVDMGSNEITNATKIEAEKLSTTDGRLILAGGTELGIFLDAFDFGGSVGIASALSFEVFEPGGTVGLGITHIRLV